MAGTLRTQSRAILAQIKRDTTASCLETAERILKCSTGRILSHTGGAGIALGSGADEADLAASAYIVTAKESGYGAAVARAGAGRADRFAPAAHVGSGSSEFRVKVAFALDRAALMHNGYFDPRAGMQMMGTPFLTDCADANFKEFEHDMIGNVNALETVQETRYKRGSEEWFESLGEQGQAEVMQEAMYQESAQVEREFGGDMREDWNRFKGAFGEGMNRQRGAFTGRTRNMTRTRAGKTYSYPVMIQTRHWETAVERLDRITEAFQAFRTNSSTADMGYSMANSAERDFVRRAIGSKAN